MSYPNPKEVSDLECVLKEDKVDEVEDELRPAEPEVGVRDLDQRNALHHRVPLLDLHRHLRYDSLQLCPHSQRHLYTKTLLYPSAHPVKFMLCTKTPSYKQRQYGEPEHCVPP